MPWLTVTEAARLHPLSKTHIRRLVADGTLKGRKVGPVWQVEEQSITRYLATDRRPGPRPLKPR